MLPPRPPAAIQHLEQQLRQPDRCGTACFPVGGRFADAGYVGVHIRPLDFGGLDGVAYLDNTGDDPFKVRTREPPRGSERANERTNGAQLTAVFADFIDNLVAIGYRAGVTLFGAPVRTPRRSAPSPCLRRAGTQYDWRLPVDTYFAGGMQAQWKALVECVADRRSLPPGREFTRAFGGPDARTRRLAARRCTLSRTAWAVRGGGGGGGGGDTR